MTELEALKYAIGIMVALFAVVVGAAIALGRKLQALDMVNKRLDEHSEDYKGLRIVQLQFMYALNRIAAKVGVEGVDVEHTIDTLADAENSTT